MGTILYANRYREDVCFRNELDQMMSQSLQDNNNELFQVKYMYSRGGAKEGEIESSSLASNEFLGRLDSAKVLQEVLGLKSNTGDHAKTTSTNLPPRFLAIGSKPMMRQAWNCLNDLGYPRGQYELLQ